MSEKAKRLQAVYMALLDANSALQVFYREARNGTDLSQDTRALVAELCGIDGKMNSLVVAVGNDLEAAIGEVQS